MSTLQHSQTDQDTRDGPVYSFQDLQAPRNEILMRMLSSMQENHWDSLAQRQLHCELHQSIARNRQNLNQDGTRHCPLYQKLPQEVRQQIFSYLVVVPENIHVYPVKGNHKHGFRLSRCDESLIDLRNGWCTCENGRPDSRVTTTYLDTELLLVSQTVRREVLDVIFLQNHFTFTSMNNLVHFTNNFIKCAAKMQHVRLLENLSDSRVFRSAESSIKTRKLLGHLKRFEVYGYISGYTSYIQHHEDGYISQLIHFAFPPPETFLCKIIAEKHGFSTGDPSLAAVASRVQQKLNKVFNGEWPDPASIPISPSPPKRVREEEIPPRVKRGILALGD